MRLISDNLQMSLNLYLASCSCCSNLARSITASIWARSSALKWLRSRSSNSTPIDELTDEMELCRDARRLEDNSLRFDMFVKDSSLFVEFKASADLIVTTPLVTTLTFCVITFDAIEPASSSQIPPRSLLLIVVLMSISCLVLSTTSTSTEYFDSFVKPSFVDTEGRFVTSVDVTLVDLATLPV